MLYDHLRLCSLTPEQHARTCDYWWTITTFGCTPHTAFRTRPALFAWLRRRGIELTAELPETGAHSVQMLSGSYIDRMHGDPLAMPHNFIGLPFLKMSNGDYTEARITEENGVRVINYLNPNAQRPVWDWRVARPIEDAGLDGLPGILEATQ